MPKIARVGDRHEGKCEHNSFVAGVITSGASKSNNEGKKIATKGSSVVILEGCSDCIGKTGEITSGSASVKCEGRSVATIGSEVTYPKNAKGKITTGGETANAE